MLCPIYQTENVKKTSNHVDGGPSSPYLRSLDKFATDLYRIGRVRTKYWLADIFCRYRYIGIGKLDIGISHIGIGIG